ncbi:hypothetical protein IHE44_0007437 [Lamprotornis superbus]|uniref:Ig-like domain-containing protein n=1 Tax=Lamprotornis superbus TaxID=245042 RepID=A0A835TZ29_9PASS|nr:hypothetical protein IHE44_0007437 [Lamprotornis superbus]
MADLLPLSSCPGHHRDLIRFPALPDPEPIAKEDTAIAPDKPQLTSLPVMNLLGQNLAQVPVEMEHRRSLTVLCGAPIVAISFLACVATGLELSVNNHAADFTLSTKLVPAISLSCLVHNSSQAEELLWYRGDGQVGLNAGNKVNISNICISPVNESDNGVTFTCRLARDKSVQLSGEETLHVEEEKDVTLTCNSKSNPQAQSTWLKDNHNLTLQQSRHEVYQTSEIFRLSIKKVQKSDNGTYTCVVESPLGYGTRDFYLIVEDKKPVFPTEAVIAAAVVVSLTILFGIVARKDTVFKELIACIFHSSCCSAIPQSIEVVAIQLLAPSQ